MLSNFFFTAILISSLIFSAYSYNGHLLCLEDQKSLLLQLKNELIFNSSFSTKLVRWNQTHDCCNWNGVDCDSAGHVISLQLDEESISGGIGVSSSLFRLSYLEKLNLAYNNFKYSTPIPKGIHRLNYLTHLNLSYAGFGGQVPIELSFLTRLVSLDISYYRYYYSSSDSAGGNSPLSLDNLEVLVQNLTGLRELRLDGVNISSSYERRKWSQIVSSYLPHLSTFSCAYCSLSGSFARSFPQLHSLSTLRLHDNEFSTPVPAFFANFSRLTTLSLGRCGLKGSFPNMIFHIPTLQNLDLSYNDQLSGSLPPFTHNGSLQSLRLRGTNFSGLIPSSISNLKNLSELVLSGCKFTGSIFPSTFANLTQLTFVDMSNNLFTGSLSPTLFQGLSNLVSVDLSRNLFSGNIPHSLFALPSLRQLGLPDNHFTGVDEFSVAFNVSELVDLDLRRNQLEGPIPDFFFQLRSLKVLSLTGNLFSGTFQLEKIRSLANLTNLDLSDNKLRVDVSIHNSTSYGFPQLTFLYLASCNLNVFPDFIKWSHNMSELDLSKNGIGGEIPSWIWGLTQLDTLDLSHNLLTRLQKPYHIPSSRYYLDLSSNQIRGELSLLIPPNNLSYFSTLRLSNNSFSGSIPTSLCTATYLETLDLSANKLSGSIPFCLFDLTISNLTMVHLGENNISGRIPDNFPLFSRLNYLDLNNNTLEGENPRSLKNCQQLEFMNVANNIISDTFPCMLPSSLRVLVLHSNSFHGEVTSCDHNSWPDLQILDISSNHFTGSLEKINFSSWRGMMEESDSQLGHENSVNYSGHYSDYYGLYSSGVTLIMKGLQVELYKIWSNFSTIDFSTNNFEGDIPNIIGELSSLHYLNLSHNALNGSIPKSFGKLRNLESLDLSRNQLTGAIPRELAEVSFLSVLNLSYNKLVGEIPNDPHFQTFSADSFEGNPELCGFNLNISCTTHTVDLSHENEGGEKEEIEWEFVSAALGYVVGLGSIVWLLLFCRSFRKKYFDKIEEVVEEMFDARDKRRRRRATARRRAVRNQAIMRRRQ